MRKINNILIIGAGFMGEGIAQVAAESGFQVSLNDINDEAVSKALNNIYGRWENKVFRNKITQDKIDEYKLRISGCNELENAVLSADMIIEAIIEKSEMKIKLFEKLKKICKEDVIIASNTSSLSVTALAAETDKPENFIGMHFFSPVPAMKLLEIIPGMLSSEDTVETAKEVGKQLGKICIISKDNAGFIVNRLLDPMLNEAIQLLDDGVGTIEDIDAGMKYGCAHPMGPFELLDMAGIDVEYAVMQVLYTETGDPKYRPAPLLRKMVRAGYLGKKKGKGFYIYNNDGSKIPNPYFNK